MDYQALIILCQARTIDFFKHYQFWIAFDRWPIVISVGPKTHSDRIFVFFFSPSRQTPVQ